MQIIAGDKRGKKLVAPEGMTTRPILQLLKQRLFDILGPRFHGVNVWDFFAGSGSLGLEALSRGAASALFVEADRASFRTLEANVKNVGYTDRAVLWNGDVFRGAHSEKVPSPSVVFLDPPFPIMRDTPHLIRDLIDDVIAPALATEGTIVLRVPVKFTWTEGPRRMRLRDRRDHGEQGLLFYVPEPTPEI